MVTTLPYITEELSGSYAEYGYFMAGFPVGFILGSILVGKIKYKSRRRLMLGALFIGGLTFVFLFINTSVILGILAEAAGGIAMAVFGIHNTTICQKNHTSPLNGKNILCPVVNYPVYDAIRCIGGRIFKRNMGSPAIVFIDRNGDKYNLFIGNTASVF